MFLFKKKDVWLFMFFIISLAACGAPEEDSPVLSDDERILTQTVLLAATKISATKTAVARLPTNTPQEEVNTPTLIVPTSDGGGNSETLTPLPTQSGEATATPTPFSSATPLPPGSTPCYRANLEYETIPDGTRLPRNKEFVKLWRLKNTGTCTWTAAFSAIFVDGNLMGATASVPLTTVDVPPGGFVELSVDMVAPTQPGTYTGNWMLLSPDGVIFGVGPEGLDWFWILIDVFLPQ